MTETEWKDPTPDDPFSIARGLACTAIETLEPLLGDERKQAEEAIELLRAARNALEKAQRGAK